VEGFLIKVNRLFAIQILATAALAALAACGGGGGGGSPTSPGDSGGGSPGPSGATITISGGRVSPSQVTISVGQSVTFTNNDGRVRNVSSDPHPVHTDCPGLNFGSLQPGQQRTSQPLTAARSCGIHDHITPGSQSLMRTIVIR
jgi:hypothetical protein